MDVIIDNAGSNASTSEPGSSTPEQQPSSEVPTGDAVMQTTESATIPSEPNAGSNVDEAMLSSGASEIDAAKVVLLSLPQTDLRLLCSLLATEG